MRDNYTLSDVGLRLIKSYEGFRPVDIELASGQRVVGYGHRVTSGKAQHVTRAEADDLLRTDLQPFESMVNDAVFAPLAQGQFDAMVSLAFNIGPKKFLKSSVLRAFNNGRILDAANGFDVWRRGDINGESFVVDALVRRRTAEKILFLRPDGNRLRAPRVELMATADEAVQALHTRADERVYEDDGFAQTVPYERRAAAPAQTQSQAAVQPPQHSLAQPIVSASTSAAVLPQAEPAQGAALLRRRDDRPGGVLVLSEVLDDLDIEDDGPLELENYEDAPLVEDAGDFSLDIDAAPLELNDVVDYDDLVDVEDPALLEIPSGAEDMRKGMFTPARSFNPDLDITANDPAAPSMIAAAAADVSDRLDALMADDKSKIIASDTDLEEAAGYSGESKVVQFPSHSIVRGGAENQGPKSLATGGSAAKEAVSADMVEDKNLEAGLDDSASRYISRSEEAKKSAKPAASTAKAGPLHIMVVLGMILGGCSLGSILSGFAASFGTGGEFAATIGVLFGLTLFLGSVYYVLKNNRRTA